MIGAPLDDVTVVVSISPRSAFCFTVRLSMPRRRPTSMADSPGSGSGRGRPLRYAAILVRCAVSFSSRLSSGARPLFGPYR